MPKWEPNAGEPIEANEQMQQELLVDEQECQEHAKTDPPRGWECGKDWLKGWHQRKSVEEQTEQKVGQILDIQ